jgi:ArsR family transcriptional regulator
MPPVSPLQLFKSLSDETRLSLVLLLREKGSSASVNLRPC